MQSGDQAKRKRKRRKIDKLRGPVEGGVGFLAVRVVRAGRISADRCPGNRGDREFKLRAEALVADPQPNACPWCSQNVKPHRG